MTTNALAIIVVSALAAALRADPEPCKLLTVAEITSALGNAPAAEEIRGPEIDTQMQVKNWACDRQVGKYMLSLDVFDFQSEAAVARGIAEMRKTQDPFPLQAVPGERDQALWGSSEEGAIWVAVKGKYVVTLTLAGDLANPTSFREPLKRLAGSALARL
jgi:hypothetical protein